MDIHMMCTSSSLEVFVSHLDCSVVSHTSDSPISQVQILGVQQGWVSRSRERERNMWVSDPLKEKGSLMSCSEVSDNQMG